MIKRIRIKRAAPTRILQTFAGVKIATPKGRKVSARKTWKKLKPWGRYGPATGAWTRKRKGVPKAAKIHRTTWQDKLPGGKRTGAWNVPRRKLGTKAARHLIARQK